MRIASNIVTRALISYLLSLDARAWGRLEAAAPRADTRADIAAEEMRVTRTLLRVSFMLRVDDVSLR